jgi:uncharacterized protein (DUF1697 family)
MKLAVFFRNLNLGRPPAPTRQQLEAAFLEGGARSAQSFLTNGTLVFEPAPRSRGRREVEAACAILQRTLGFAEPAFVRPLPILAGLVARQPFRGIDPASVYERCITFLPDRFVLPQDAPRANASGNVRVLEYAAADMFSVSLKLGASPGSPNLFAERQFGVPATTRAWNTVVRLVERHAPLPP